MTQTDQEFFKASQPAAGFPTTHWSVVLMAASPVAPSAAAALEKLCRTYWRPVHAFIRRQRQCPEDALDLTQEFFAHFLENEYFVRADPERGQLRSYLLSALKHFLADERARARAEKRGGGRPPIALAEGNAAEAFQVADLAAPPDLAYEKQWAHNLLDHALAALQPQSATTAEREQFDILKAFIWGGAPAASQVEIAAQLCMTPNALGVAVHRLRRRYGELLRKAVARTVTDSGEIEGELRHLIAVISA